MRIHTIDLEDLGVAGAIAAYVVIGSEGPVLIETGPAATLPALRRGLEALGLELPDIRHALVTHIHFDHAGAAGHL
ncbi:MAG: MBL fold metallo-hydrolase, partial [Planctomycetota bacterium]